MAFVPGTPTPTFDRLLDLNAAGAIAALRAAEDFLLAMGVVEKARDRVALVLEEALMNLVMHGAHMGAVRSASFQISLHPESIELKVVDDGQPFDPRDHALPALPVSLESAIPGGQGLRLMRRFTRETQYATGEHGNCLTLLLDRG